MQSIIRAWLDEAQHVRMPLSTSGDICYLLLFCNVGIEMVSAPYPVLRTTFIRLLAGNGMLYSKSCLLMTTTDACSSSPNIQQMALTPLGSCSSKKLIHRR